MGTISSRVSSTEYEANEITRGYLSINYPFVHKLITKITNKLQGK